MLVMIWLFVTIAVPVFGFVYMYNKYLCNYVTDDLARKIELFGYVLLFIVVIWQMIVKNIMMESFYDAEWYYLENNLYQIHSMLERHVKDLSPFTSHYDYMWKDSQGEYVQTQMKIVDIVEAVLTIASTVCIAIGRFQDLKKLKD